MCVITSVNFQNIMHGRCKGTIEELKEFQKRIIDTLVKLKAFDEGGAIKKIHSSEVIDGLYTVDMEIWILLNKPVELDGEFDFIKNFSLDNILMVEHIGSPTESGKTIENLQTYIQNHNLRAKSPAYNHSLHKVRNGMSEDEMHFKVYLEVEKNE